MFSALVKLHGSMGLAVQITSAVDKAVNDELEEIWGKDTKTARRGGAAETPRLSKQFITDHMSSQVNTVAHSPVRHGDDYQYDAAEGQLMTRGQILEGGREVASDITMDTLALHLYEAVSVFLNEGTTQRLHREAKGQKDGAAKAKSIVYLFKKVYFPAICARLLGICFQQMLMSRIEILLPLVFKKVRGQKKIERVMAYIDSRYLDPVHHEAHLLERSRELVEDMLGIAMPTE